MSDYKFQLFLDLLEEHKDFKEKSITQKRFRHHQILDILDKYSNKYKIEEIGRSVEGRPIKLITIGRGETKILLWSQMHGDEPTSTMSLMDILSFFESNNERFKNVKDIIERELTIYFIPVLNPDGAEAYTRRNAAGIDLNRDAKALISPEARAFKSVIDKIKPQFAFNLHDQNPRYTVGDTTEVAAISFLAPPFDYHRSLNHIRGNAMKLIGVLNQLMQKILPGRVGRFSDEYEGRAFGDNIQKWGISTILLESGGFENDREKQELRKFNFALLVSAFNSIAKKDYQEVDLKEYEQIPFNTRNVYDLIIRNAEIEIGQQRFKVDIGINRYETPNQYDFYFKSKIEEFGDLSNFRGIEEMDAAGMSVVKGKSHEETVDIESINYKKAINYLRQGITYLKTSDLIKEEGSTSVPINFTNKATANSGISIDSNADLIFILDGEVKAVVVNGFPVNLDATQQKFRNGLLVP